uniref:persulfide dioxygenase n=1 Tax=Prymnesium polylepis TaxID=72548 RepID=A0A7S4N959_9EUKA
MDARSMPLGALPADRNTPLILYCRSGRRAGHAKGFLEANGYTRVLNAGGVVAHAQTTIAALGQPLHRHSLGIFLQVFDGPAPDGGGSSTYTYIVGDAASKECIIIDPVLEQVEHDLKMIDALGLTLTLALNTHCHADHITGTGAIKRQRAGVTSLISKASGAKADCHLKPGEEVRWAEGRRTLTALATPGHTDGCMCFFDESIGVVFTGDALLIGGCGRTDFQQGSSETLYESVHNHLFSLPGSTLVLPAHDYKGRAYSTISAEKSGNPRLSKDKSAFVQIMRDLQLPYPKKIDVSLPANLMCGM